MVDIEDIDPDDADEVSILDEEDDVPGDDDKNDEDDEPQEVIE